MVLDNIERGQLLFEESVGDSYKGFPPSMEGAHVLLNMFFAQQNGADVCSCLKQENPEKMRVVKNQMRGQISFFLNLRKKDKFTFYAREDGKKIKLYAQGKLSQEDKDSAQKYAYEIIKEQIINEIQGTLPLSAPEDDFCTHIKSIGFDL